MIEAGVSVSHQCTSINQSINNTAWKTDISLKEGGARWSPYAVLSNSSDHKVSFPSNNKFIGSVYSNWAENCFCMAREECEAKQWFLMWNMAAETHLWHPALSPPAYLRKQVASCTPPGRGVPEKQKCGGIWRKCTTLRINEAVVSPRGSWQEGWTGAWPAADSSPRRHAQDRLCVCSLDAVLTEPQPV